MKKYLKILIPILLSPILTAHAIDEYFVLKYDNYSEIYKGSIHNRLRKGVVNARSTENSTTCKGSSTATYFPGTAMIGISSGIKGTIELNCNNGAVITGNWHSESVSKTYGNATTNKGEKVSFFITSSANYYGNKLDEYDNDIKDKPKLNNKSNSFDSFSHLSNYNTKEYEFNPRTLEYKTSNNIDKKVKKKYNKINKLYKEGKYLKILQIEKDFLPALYSSYFYQEQHRSYDSALKYLKEIKTKYPDFNPNVINTKIISNLYNSKQYKATIIETKKVGEKYPYYNYYLAASYYNLESYNDALSYARKVKSSNDMYVKSQEIIYNCLVMQKNIPEAYRVAKNLIQIDSTNSEHYLKIVYCSSNINEKLKYLYKLRDMLNESSINQETNSSIIAMEQTDINSSIIALEQLKINNIVKNSKKYINKPDWAEIISSVSQYGSYNYWVERQDKFFKSTNDCMKSFSGSDLSACFTSVIAKQNALNQQLLQEEQMQQESRYQQAVLEQNERMIRLQQLSNFNQMIMNTNLQNINTNIQQNNFYQMQMNNNLRNINNSLLYMRF